MSKAIERSDELDPAEKTVDRLKSKRDLAELYRELRPEGGA
jgi:hypothetical protein